MLASGRSARLGDPRLGDRALQRDAEITGGDVTIVVIVAPHLLTDHLNE